MDEASIVRMFERLEWKPKLRGEWVSTSCPFASMTHENGADKNPSFGISVHPDSESRYNCMACGKHGALASLPTTLEFMGAIDSEGAELMRSAISDAETFSTGQTEEGYLVDLAPCLSEYTLERFQNLRKSHIASRGIEEQSVHTYELRWDRAENRLMFSIRDSDGRLVGMRGRYIGPDKDPDILRYREYSELSPSRRSAKKFGVWYGGHLPKQPNKATILVEGEIDLIRMKQVFPNANVLASIGASITKEQLRALEFPEKGIIAFFDNDMAGKKALATVLEEAKRRGIKTPIYKIKDYCGCTDVDEIIKKGGRDLLVQALSSLDKAN